jgi:DNA adenine methylase
MSNVVKWHGGKHYLAEWIVSHFPPHLHYVEPFFGGGAVLFARDPTRNWMEGHPEAHTGDNGQVRSYHSGASEVVNDVHQELTNFWRVLQDPEKFPRFQRRVEMTPFSQVEWEAAFEPSGDEAERAAKFFIRYRQSRQASAWLSAIEGLPEAHGRLRGVVILCQDANQVIRTQDGPFTLYYCDPPYVPETRAAASIYEHEMSVEEHRRLLETLLAVEGKVILSGYHNPLYDEMLAGWRVAERLIDNKSGSGKTKQMRTEVLWMNYP